MKQNQLFNIEPENPPLISLDPNTAPDKFQIIYADPPWDYNDRTFLDGKVNDTGAASGPQLLISLDVMQAWGFRYKTVSHVWQKIRCNPGYYTMSSTEFIIVGTRGSIPKPRGTRNERQFHEQKRTKHSAKPSHFRETIERMHPKQTKLELFARIASPGWYVWGLDAPNPVHLPGILGVRDDLPW